MIAEAKKGQANAMRRLAEKAEALVKRSLGDTLSDARIVLSKLIAATADQASMDEAKGPILSATIKGACGAKGGPTDELRLQAHAKACTPLRTCVRVRARADMQALVRCMRLHESISVYACQEEHMVGTDGMHMCLRASACGGGGTAAGWDHATAIA